MKIKGVFFDYGRWCGIKKAKCVNKNVVDDIGHKEYVDVLFG